MKKIEARAYALKNRLNKNKYILEEKLVNEIIKSNVLDKYKHIGIYYPIGDEMSVLKLLSYYTDKNFYLPITKDEISFVLPGTDLKRTLVVIEKKQNTSVKYPRKAGLPTKKPL